MKSSFPDAGAGRGDLPLLALLTLLGIAVRAGHLAAPYMDSDQAVFGLQALHVFKGEFPAFSWGYAYIGTLQTFIDAAFFAVFGASRVVLNGVVLIFYAGYSVSLWYLSGALLPERRWKALATAIGAVAPGYFVHHGVWARHGYPETFFFGTLLLALMCNHLEPEERPRFHGALFFVVGLAWWSNFLILYYFLPLGLYLLYQLLLGSSLRSRVRVAAAAGAGFLAGSLPFWVHNVRNGFDSMDMFRKAPQQRGALEEATTTGWNTFTVLVGAREQGADYTVAYLGPVLGALAAAALLFFVVRLVAGLRRIPARRRLAPGDILLLFLLSLPLVFAVSGQSLRGIRYLIPFYSIYPIFLAFALRSLARVRGARWLAGVLTVFLFAMNTASALEWNPLLDPEGRRRYRESAAADQRLIDDLVQADRRQVLTYNYWDAYRLTFDAGERVIVDHVNSRHLEYLLDMFSDPNVSYLTRGKNPSFEEGVRLLGYSFVQRAAGRSTLYTDLRPAFPRRLSTVPAAGYRLRSNQGRGDTVLLNDRLLSAGLALTNGEGAPEPQIDIDLQGPTDVAGLAVFPAIPGTVPPRIRVTDQETGRVLAEGGNVYYGYLLGGRPYLPGASPIMEVYFPPCTTSRLRLSFAGPATRREQFTVNEVLVFETLQGGSAGSDEQLFTQIGRIGRDSGVAGIFCGMAAVRPLERALGHAVAYVRTRSVSFEKRNLFVFEREYLRHNLDVLDALGIAHESGAGEVFAYIATRGTGWGEGRWLEKALFLEHDPAKARADYLKALKVSAGDDRRAETLLRRALARDPDHFGSLVLLKGIYERRRDANGLGEIRLRLGKLLPPGLRLEATFGKAFSFVSLAQGAREARPGETVALDIALTPVRSVRPDSWAFVHVLSPEGKILFQSDRLLGSAEDPRYHPGDLVRREYVLAVPPDLTYRGPAGIWLGISEPGDTKKLKIKTSLPTQGKRVRVGEVVILP